MRIAWMRRLALSVRTINRRSSPRAAISRPHARLCLALTDLAPDARAIACSVVYYISTKTYHFSDRQRLVLYELRNAAARLECDVARVTMRLPRLAQEREGSARDLHGDFLQKRATKSKLEARVRRRNLVAHQVEGSDQLRGFMVQHNAHKVRKDAQDRDARTLATRTSKTVRKEGIWDMQQSIARPVRRVDACRLEFGWVLCEIQGGDARVKLADVDPAACRFGGIGWRTLGL